MLDTRAFVSLCIAYGIAMAVIWTVVNSSTVQLTVTLVGAGLIAIAAVYLSSSDETSES